MSTVLIIDDDPTIRDLFFAYLSGQGFRVVTAAEGKNGLLLFDAEGPDFVLCDLNMPGMGGLGVLAEVQRRSPHTPFVVVSGSHDLAQAIEALRRGAWDYVLKPLPSLELLLPLLARMEERAHFLREKELSQNRLEEQIKVRTAQLTRQLKEKDLLIAEVHHRVKNNLQIMQVLLSLQHDHASISQVREALEATQSRIHTLAIVQEEMHDSDHATLVNARSYATGLINHLLSAHRLTAYVELVLDLEDLALGPSLAFTCGLVVNELVAGLAQTTPPQGPWTLSLGLRTTSPGTVEITLVDSRGAWAQWVPAPGRPSVGWDLVSALANQDGGAMVWDPLVPGTITVRLT